MMMDAHRDFVQGRHASRLPPETDLKRVPHVPAMRVTLVDKFYSLVDAANAVGWTEVEKVGGTDIRDVPLVPGTAVVSPANSLGFMDGGIDYVLSRVMFPGVEQRVKAAIARSGQVTKLGRPYLPIGEAVTVPTGRPGVALIAAPTMWLPQRVDGTHNPYHAMYAVLRAASQDPSITHVVVPGLCTGVGMVRPPHAVRMMMEAHRDFVRGRPARWDAAAIVSEQPTVYMNSEFKDMDATDIRHA